MNADLGEFVIAGVPSGTAGSFTHGQLIANQVAFTTVAANYPDGPDTVVEFTVHVEVDGNASADAQLILEVESCQ